MAPGQFIRNTMGSKFDVGYLYEQLCKTFFRTARLNLRNGYIIIHLQKGSKYIENILQSFCTESILIHSPDILYMTP